VYEKLIEHWLTNINELGFQLPLCEALLALGYTVLHVSKHGRGEHGKDIIARDPQGVLTTFQLKGGNIDLPTWRNIRGEIEELVQLPVMLPGIDRTEPHAPFLVTNGDLRGDAVPSIREYSDRWHAQGHGSLVVWQKTELLQKFIAAHGSYVPSASLTDFRSFVELYVADFADRLPRQKFVDFVFSLYPADGTPVQKRRALQSAILTGDYVVAQYEKAQNHVATLEGYTILAMLVMYAVERDGLVAEAYKPTLNLLTTGFDRAAASFLKEVISSEHLVSPRLTIAEDPEVRGARTVLVLGWLSALWHRARFLDEENEALRQVRRIIRREVANMVFLTEADWPYLMSIILFVERDETTTAGEKWLNRWIEAVLRKNGSDDAIGFPSPYWLQEKALAFRYGKLPPDEAESFRRHTYTVHSALDMLVRRLCRQTVGGYWKRVSNLTFCDVIPDQACDWFRWRCEKADSRMALLPLSMSWAEWRQDTGTVQDNLIPQILIGNPDWLLPFALVFPHRVNRRLSAIIDATVGDRAIINY
jgi:hypothetical protein